MTQIHLSLLVGLIYDAQNEPMTPSHAVRPSPVRVRISSQIFPIISPGSPFLPNWHVEAIAYANGHRPRLSSGMPIRCPASNPLGREDRRTGVFRVGEAKHLNNIELGRHGRSRSNVWHYAPLQPPRLRPGACQFHHHARTASIRGAQGR